MSTIWKASARSRMRWCSVAATRGRRTLPAILLMLAILGSGLPALASPQPSPSPQHGLIADEDWKLAPGEHVDLYFTAGSPAADDIADLKDLAEQDFARIANLLHQYAAGKVRIYLFPDELKMKSQGNIFVASDKRLVHLLYNDDAR